MKEHAMPSLRIGAHTISRLILGANTINGGSHLSRFVNVQMKRYFTPGQIQKTLRASEKAGINTWQAGPGNLDAYLEYKRSGGSMHFISLDHEQNETGHSLDRLTKAGAIAVAHHGEVTDKLFSTRSLESVRPFLDKI